MTDQGVADLLNEVLERLVATDAPNDVVDAVLAAAGGEADFAAWTGGTAPVRPSATHGSDEIARPGVFLTGLSVEGFRGIGPKATLKFAPGPGLNVVVGRNGCGKSSFTEALEVLLTGTTRRFDIRTEAWREGWRNLHHNVACSVQAVAHLEGDTVDTTLTRSWPADALETGAVRDLEFRWDLLMRDLLLKAATQLLE